MAQSRPKVPTVVSTDANGKVTVTSRELVPFTRINVTEQALIGKGGQVDPKTLARVLGLMQDNGHDSTLPQRSNPLGQFTIVEKVKMTSGASVTIRHGLGVAFAYYLPLRTYVGSSPWSVVDAAGNGNQDPTQYLVLAAHATGTYDVCVFGGA
jgi:hypothetical protein